MAVTIRDIARLSNTSIAAVSRVLNNRGGVHPDKQQRILQLARELEYTPNRNARNLAMQCSQLIGVIASDLSNNSYIDFIHQVENLGRARGYQTLIADSERDLKVEAANVATMLEHRADGILIFPVAEFGPNQNVDHFLSLRLKKVPFVLHGSVQKGSFDAVCMDEEGIGHTIGRHFAELGHSRLAVAGCDVPAETVVQRRAGFGRAADEVGARVVDDTTETGPEIYDGAYLDRWRGILTGPDRPTALFVIHDGLALVFYRAIHEWGLRIPDDVSVASIGDSQFIPYLTPSLSAANPNITDRAQAGMEMLFERIAKPDVPPVVREMRYTFIPRESTSPVPETAAL
jgi:LacI family transcriptional regulator